MLGTALVVAAPTSRAPRTLGILGVLIIVAGLATPVIAVARARLIVAWWEAQGTAFLRAWAGIALGLGLFLAYAVMPRAPRPERR